MKRVLALILFATAFVAAVAQDDTSKGNFGIGLGLDYGGIGGKVTVLPSQKVGLFAGLGYNIVGVGFNVGGLVRFSPDKKVCPYITAMYGYNAVIKITGDIEKEETYYGPSAGFGLEFHGRNNPSNFWNVELLIPFRSSDYHNDLDDLQANPYIEMNDPWPIAICVGYHFGF